ncbi:MAG: alpha/beta fold hydrolase [Flavobacteriaceae bacterium]|nr:alpha/beta fold hydrolase [Flavobacteriaceae bacterium]
MQLLHSIIIGEGQPLIILHGFFGMGDNWKTLANRFSENYQVHIVDQRNHGRSFHSDEFTYELMVEDLLFYINHYHLENVHLLGHSMGGKTVMLFAVEYSEKVDKIIIADIAPRFYPPHHHFIIEALNAVDFKKVKSRNDIDLIFEKYIPESGIRQFLAKNIYRKSKDEFAYRFNLECLTDCFDEVGVGLPPISQFYGEALFLKGENSGYISKEDEQLIAIHFPKSEIKVVKNAGHWLHAENPEDFYNYINRFLKKP